MKYIFFLIICIAFLTIRCTNEDYHGSITLKNLTGQDVIWAFRYISYPDEKCGLEGYVLANDSTVKWRPFDTYIERRLGNDNPIEMYLVDINKFNKGGAYDCDSIYIKNNILKKYTITIDTLLKTDFTIVFLK